MGVPVIEGVRKLVKGFSLKQRDLWISEGGN